MLKQGLENIEQQVLSRLGEGAEPVPPVSEECVAFGPFRLYPNRRSLFCGDEPVLVGGRAMDMLLVLAGHKGEIVKKDDLFAAVWPDVYVHESNLKVTVATLRRTLRRHAPAENFIATVAGRGYWLADLPTPTSAISQIDTSQIPDQSNSIIGRTDAIAELCEVISQHRLTSVVGVGGLGKTTVALAAAHQLAEEEEQLVAYVDMSRVAGDEFVAPTIAAALNITPGQGDILRAIMSILSQRKALLLLDTCECVPTAVAHFCNVLLASTQDVRILVTSRRILQAREERVFWLDPLENPPVGRIDTAQSVLGHTAPQLLAVRAKAKSGYSLTDADAAAFAEICRRLDGVPLAIELVASRFARRSAAEVLAELQNRFRLLRNDEQGVPLRQQTLLLTLEWSYALLTRDEAAVLRAISMFEGAFDLDAAVRLMSLDDFTPADTFEALSGLVAKSMLTTDRVAGEHRHRLLDTTREFAGDLLEAHGEARRFAHMHAQIQRDLLQKLILERPTVPAVRWRAHCGRLIGDLRKGLAWAMGEAGDVHLGVRLAAAGFPVWRELAFGVEALENIKRAYAAYEQVGLTDQSLKLELLAGLSALNSYLSQDHASAVGTYAATVELARTLGKTELEWRTLGAWARFAMRGVEQDGVGAVLDAMKRAAFKANDKIALWEEQQLRAQREANQGRFPASRRRLEKLHQDLSSRRDAGLHDSAASVAICVKKNLANNYVLTGRPALGWEMLDEISVEMLGFDREEVLLDCLASGLIYCAIESGDFARARRFNELLRKTIYRFGLAGWLPILRANDESIAALAGDTSRSSALLEAADVLLGGDALLTNRAYASVLIRAMAASGLKTEASNLIAKCFAIGLHAWIRPEFLRLRAQAERWAGNPQTALATLQEALEANEGTGMAVARLRMAIDMAHVFDDLGTPHFASSILSSAIGMFKDGSDTPDLQTARTLLQAVSPVGNSDQVIHVKAS
ncbi:winged helix-turn-helix domain-containing protein [Novosphingobium sp. AP12]|uniref:ATP-binding protein n=1 Tax=Novosphingobium sp. AP12 TaxID=1144305 RepID=UPI000271D96E|nr:winged helix-turn-helix domain-containing protein [Novosphingobium sp. AP12]EJL20403.1 putative ATPase [Novosphingobium sp. AP12]